MSDDRDFMSAIDSMSYRLTKLKASRTAQLPRVAEEIRAP